MNPNTCGSSRRGLMFWDEVIGLGCRVQGAGSWLLVTGLLIVDAQIVLTFFVLNFTFFLSILFDFDNRR